MDRVVLAALTILGGVGSIYLLIGAINHQNKRGIFIASVCFTLFALFSVVIFLSSF